MILSSPVSCKLFINSISLLFKPAMSTVVRPREIQSCCAFNNAFFLDSSFSSGIFSSINDIALSINKPVTLSFIFSIYPPMTTVSMGTFAVLMAVSLTIMAWPSILFKTTFIFLKFLLSSSLLGQFLSSHWFWSHP